MLCLYHCQAENHEMIVSEAYKGNAKAWKIMTEIDEQGIPSTRESGGIHCRYASKYTRFARKIHDEMYGLSPWGKPAGRSAAQKRCTKPQLQQRNIELEAKVESLQKELDECTALMHQSRAEVSAHHIV